MSWKFRTPVSNRVISLGHLWIMRIHIPDAPCMSCFHTLKPQNGHMNKGKCRYIIFPSQASGIGWLRVVEICPTKILHPNKISPLDPWDPHGLLEESNGSV